MRDIKGVRKAMCNVCNKISFQNSKEKGLFKNKLMIWFADILWGNFESNFHLIEILVDIW